MTIPFRKMHGAANDFVVIDHREPFIAPDATALFARWCDRRRGIGADGVLLLERDPECDFAMRYFNADGGPASYCGNGARCLARLALDLGLGRDGTVRFRTAVGVQSARASGPGRVAVEFGRIDAPGPPITLEAADRTFEGLHVVAGVPHFVTEVERVEWVPLEVWGPALRQHPQLAPDGANVDVVARLQRSRVAMRTYERGVEAQTLACGSGAIASALWAHLKGDASPIAVLTAGGDELIVTFTSAGDKGGWRVQLEGPVEMAFTGTWSDDAATGATGIRPRGASQGRA